MAFNVSVIIPVFNAEKYIERAVISALLDEVYEIILIDDASVDGSVSICNNLADRYSKVHFYQHKDKKNHGPAATRNFGIVKSRSEYIAFLDADDFYLPHRFEKEKELLNSVENDIDGVYGATHTVFESESAKELFYKGDQNEIISLTEEIPPENLFEELLWQRKGQFSTDGITLKKSIFKKSGLFNNKIRLGQDTELWYRVALVGKLFPGFIHKPVALRQIHLNNHIHTSIDKYNIQRRLGYSLLTRWVLLNSQIDYNKKDVLFTVMRVYQRLFDAHVPERVFYFKILWKLPVLVFSDFLWRKGYQLFIKAING